MKNAIRIELTRDDLELLIAAIAILRDECAGIIGNRFEKFCRDFCVRRLTRLLVFLRECSGTVSAPKSE